MTARKGAKGKPAAKSRAKPKTTQQRRQAQPGYAATMQLRAQILELRTLGRTIPQIAEQVGSPKAVRAVGAANGQNPISIIAPCHRVVGANGKLVGFAGGLENKEILLKIEKLQ